MLILIASHWHSPEEGRNYRNIPLRHMVIRQSVLSIISSMGSMDTLVVSISGHISEPGCYDLQQYFATFGKDVRVLHRSNDRLSQMQHIVKLLDEFPLELWLAVCDDDDFVSPHWLHMIKQHINATKAIQLISVPYGVLTSNQRLHWDYPLDISRLHYTDYHHPSDYGGMCAHIPLIREAISDIKSISTDLINSECSDVPLTIRLLDIAKTRSAYAILKCEPLYFYMRYNDFETCSGPF